MHTQAATTDCLLLPGQYFVGSAPHRVRTLLGSCVSVTLWEPLRRIGAMSHCLLAGRRGSGRPDARYADDALALMLAELAAMGVAPDALQAKVFGGGSMFPSLIGPHGELGRRNGEAACALLATQGIPLLSHSLYGVGHRRIEFDLSNGDVWSRQHRPSAVAAALVIPMRMPRELSATLSVPGERACHAL